MTVAKAIAAVDATKKAPPKPTLREVQAQQTAADAHGDFDPLAELERMQAAKESTDREPGRCANSRAAARGLDLRTPAEAARGGRRPDRDDQGQGCAGWARRSRRRPRPRAKFSVVPKSHRGAKQPRSSRRAPGRVASVSFPVVVSDDHGRSMAQ